MTFPSFHGGKIMDFVDLLVFRDTSHQTPLETLNQKFRGSADLLREFRLLSMDHVSDENRHFELGEYIISVMHTLESRIRDAGIAFFLDIPLGLVVESVPEIVCHILPAWGDQQSQPWIGIQ